MGMHEEAPSAPDTYGLVEYFITDIYTEAVGGNVRIVCGARHGSHVQWLYSTIVPADRLMTMAQTCFTAGQETFNASEIVSARKAH